MFSFLSVVLNMEYENHEKTDLTYLEVGVVPEVLDSLPGLVVVLCECMLGAAVRVIALRKITRVKFRIRM